MLKQFNIILDCAGKNGKIHNFFKNQQISHDYMKKIISAVSIYLSSFVIMPLTSAAEYFESGDFKDINCGSAHSAAKSSSKQIASIPYTIKGSILTTPLHKGNFELVFADPSKQQYVYMQNNKEIASITIYPNRFVHSINDVAPTQINSCMGSIIRYALKN